MHTNLKGFTLVEIMVVIVIIALLTAFALPNYRRTIEKADERIAVANLNAVKAGVRVWLANSGNTAIPNWGNLGQINADLKLSLIDNTMSYSCSPNSGGNTNVCFATHPAGWTIEFHDANQAIHCAAGPACPNCTASDCGV